MPNLCGTNQPGKFIYEGNEFDAPSTIVKAIKGYDDDGWNFFRTINPDTGKEVRIKDLRWDGVRKKRIRSNLKK